MQLTLRIGSWGAMALLAAAVPLAAQEGPAPGVTHLDTVVISAADAGPHVWEYRRGERTLLVLGTIAPVPTDLDFIPATLQKSVDASTAVIGSPGVVVGEGIGLLRGLSLWSSIRQRKYLPEGRTLSDTLAPEDYRRWSALKARYLPRNRDVERMLPMYAAWQLYDAVLEQSGIAQRKVSAADKVIELARAKRVGVTEAKFHLVIDNPRRAIAQFRVDPQADLACLRDTMRGIESLPGLSRQLAQDWSAGNVEAMQALLQTHTLPTPCWSALTNQAIARQQGVDLEQAVRESWVAAVQGASAAHPVVFLTAPVTDLLNGTGRAQWLQQLGYVPVAPAQPPGPAVP